MMVARSQSTMHNGAEGGGGVGHSTVAGGGRRTGRPWRMYWTRAGGGYGDEDRTERAFPRNVFIPEETDCRASVTPEKSREERRREARAGRGLDAGDKVNQSVHWDGGSTARRGPVGGGRGHRPRRGGEQTRGKLPLRSQRMRPGTVVRWHVGDKGLSDHPSTGGLGRGRAKLRDW